MTDKVVVTAKPGVLDKAVATTPAGMPDLQVVAMSWFRQAAVRTVRTYLQALVGFLVAGGIAETTGALDTIGEAVETHLPMTDFLDVFVAAASLSVAPAVVAAIQNAIEILARLDHPATRA